MRGIIANLQNSATWKIKLTIAINFAFSKNVADERVMYSNSKNIKVMPSENANKSVDELIESPF